MCQCCRCNGSGCCKNCLCVKAGNACIDCLPSKRQTCSNQPIQSLQSLPTGNPPSSQSTATSISVSRPSSPHNYDLDESQPLKSERHSLLMPTTEDLTHDGLVEVSNLPDFNHMANPEFIWGELESTSFTKSLESAYKETVHWRKNSFRIPQGKAGKSFIYELARLFQAFTTGSALESVALKAATVLPLLLLQKSHHNFKSKDHVACLERRMKLWEEGNITELVREGTAIQNRIPQL